MNTKSKTEIVLPQLKVEKIRIRLKGKTPLLVHCFSQKVVDEIENSQTGGAKVGKGSRDPEQEYQDSFYYMEDGTYGAPIMWFKSSVVNAANDAGIQMTKIRRAFHVIGNELTKLEGEPRMRRDMVRTATGVAMPRYRPEFLQWGVTIELIYNTGVISLEQLVNLFRIAGFGVGVGDWRPQRNGTFGTFEVETVEVLGNGLSVTDS